MTTFFLKKNLIDRFWLIIISLPVILLLVAIFQISDEQSNFFTKEGNMIDHNISVVRDIQGGLSNASGTIPKGSQQKSDNLTALVNLLVLQRQDLNSPTSYNYMKTTKKVFMEAQEYTRKYRLWPLGESSSEYSHRYSEIKVLLDRSLPYENGDFSLLYPLAIVSVLGKIKSPVFFLLINVILLIQTLRVEFGSDREFMLLLDPKKIKVRLIPFLETLLFTALFITFVTSAAIIYFKIGSSGLFTNTSNLEWHTNWPDFQDSVKNEVLRTVWTFLMLSWVFQCLFRLLLLILKKPIETSLAFLVLNGMALFATSRIQQLSFEGNPFYIYTHQMVPGYASLMLLTYVAMFLILIVVVSSVIIRRR